MKISNGSKTYPAKVVGTDVTDDVAVIQAEGAVGPDATITFGDSSSLSVGDSVVAIGNALTSRARRPSPTAASPR